jgi:uncharacterized protein involved in response to NO
VPRSDRLSYVAAAGRLAAHDPEGLEILPLGQTACQGKLVRRGLIKRKVDATVVVENLSCRRPPELWANHMTSTCPALLAKHWRVFSAAPHRMFFTSGILWLLVLSAWWVLLLMARALGSTALEPAQPALLLHGASLLYLGFTPFIFSFLLTVFPRWMQAPEAGRPAILGALVLLNLGLVASLGGMAGSAGLLVSGWLLAAAALGLVFLTLASLLARARSRVVHAWAVLWGMAAGLAGMALFGYSLVTGDFRPWPLVRGLGLWGFLLVVYFGVSHRMIPFFSSRVVSGYVIWRPAWLLYLFVLLALARALLEIVPMLAWVASVPLAAIALSCAWRWRPRQPSGVRLLDVLHISLAWLAAGLLLAAAADIAAALSLAGLVGRAPLHALGMGFFGGMLMAMVTRVTMGHSGRPLAMDALSWRLFLTIQVATMLRVGAEFLPAAGQWLSLVAGVLWLSAFAAWSARILPIYLRPRLDGVPG